MALLADSSVSMEILCLGYVIDIQAAPAGWTCNALKSADQKPSGKTIIPLVTTGIFQDCRSGLGRSGYRIVPSAWARFKKGAVRRKPVDRNTHFPICKIQPTDSVERRRQGDRHDKACFKALESAVAPGIGDRRIVSAPADKATSNLIANKFVRLESGIRLRIVDSKNALDELIMN